MAHIKNLSNRAYISGSLKDNIPLCHRMSVHPGPSGDDTQVRFIGMEPQILPDLLLLLGKLIRRRDPTHLIQEQLSLRLHFPDERFQLRLALLPGVGVDAFGMLCAVRPGGGVASLKQMVIDLGNTPGARLSLSPQHRLEVFD